MASFKQPNLLTGKVAGADLSSSQHKAVKLDASGNVILAGAGEGLGLLMNDPVSGDFAEVAVLGGGALGTAAAALNEGDELASDASGDLVAAVSTDVVVGLAMEAAAIGDKFEVLVVHYIKP